MDEGGICANSMDLTLIRIETDNNDLRHRTIDDCDLIIPQQDLRGGSGRSRRWTKPLFNLFYM